MMKRLILLALLMPSMLISQRDTAKAREAYLSGRQAMRDKRTSDAISAFNKAVELNDRSSDYYVWLGHAHTRDIKTANFMRQPVVARRIKAAYDRAVELDTMSANAAEARWEFYMNAPGIAGGGMDKARAEAARLKKLDAYRGDLVLARMEEHDRRYAEAETMYQGVIQSPADSTTRSEAQARLKLLRAKLATAQKPPSER
jgi:hypothetical protein